MSAGDAADVGLELLDVAALGGDDVVHEVADGDEAGELAVFEHGEMADAVVGHQVEAFLNGAVGGNGDDVAGDDFTDEGGAESALGDLNGLAYYQSWFRIF